MKGRKAPHLASPIVHLNEIDKSVGGTRTCSRRQQTLAQHSDDRKVEGGLRTRGLYKKTLERMPLLSVITVVRNGEKCIEATIRSVLNQEYKNIEYLIVDGCSKDGTLDIIRKYERSIDYWVSEEDTGIYDAMNKGIGLAAGKGLLFLNAGDHFVGNVLNNQLTIPCFLSVRYIDVFHNMRELRIKNYRRGIPNCHQGVVFENRGLQYDLRYQLASDYDYYLRHGYSYLPFLQSSGYVFYDNEGLSRKNAAIRDREIVHIIKKRFGIIHASAFLASAMTRLLVRNLLVKSCL